MAKELTVGDKAPALSLPDQSGEPVSLKDFSGKQVVLYFYPKMIPRAVQQNRATFVMLARRSRRRGRLCWA